MSHDAAYDALLTSIEEEEQPLVQELEHAAYAASDDDVHESVSEERRHKKLYDVQHWRMVTGRYLDGTTYGYDPELPPLTQEHFREMPSAAYHAVVGAVAGGLAGERIAFECSAALCAYAPDDNARMFLATQVIDEARHVEVFTHRLKMLVHGDLDETRRRGTGDQHRSHDVEVVDHVERRVGTPAIRPSGRDGADRSEISGRVQFICHPTRHRPRTPSHQTSQICARPTSGAHAQHREDLAYTATVQELSARPTAHRHPFDAECDAHGEQGGGDPPQHRDRRWSGTAGELVEHHLDRGAHRIPGRACDPSR
jgi:hypothetical protein